MKVSCFIFNYDSLQNKICIKFTPMVKNEIIYLKENIYIYIYIYISPSIYQIVSFKCFWGSSFWVGYNWSDLAAAAASKSSEKVKVKVTQLCPTLQSQGLKPARPFFHGILQARVPEWVAVPFSGRSSQPRDWTQVSDISGGFFTIWVTREAL